MDNAETALDQATARLAGISKDWKEWKQRQVRGLARNSMSLLFNEGSLGQVQRSDRQSFRAGHCWHLGQSLFCMPPCRGELDAAAPTAPVRVCGAAVSLPAVSCGVHWPQWTGVYGSLDPRPTSQLCAFLAPTNLARGTSPLVSGPRRVQSQGHSIVLLDIRQLSTGHRLPGPVQHEGLAGGVACRRWTRSLHWLSCRFTSSWLAQTQVRLSSDPPPPQVALKRLPFSPARSVDPFWRLPPRHEQRPRCW